jgi:large subunit ribosomal protein L23
MSTRTVIRRPIITEKASRLKEKHNIYVFEVDRDSNKIEIRKSIQELFKVTVEAVRTSIVHGKIKSRGRFKGRRADWKRAVVQLKQGDTIEFFEGA